MDNDDDIDVMIADSEKRLTQLKTDLHFEEMHRQRLIDFKKGKRSKWSHSPITNDPNNIPNRNGGHRPAGFMLKDSLASRIKEVLQTEGHPMKATQIAKILKDQGYETKAKAGLTVMVSTALAHGKDTIFRKVKKGLYEATIEEAST